MFQLKPYIPDIRPGKALDVGTRFGEFAFRIAKAMPAGSLTIGIDCDKQTVEEAQRKNTDETVVFRKMDGECLTFSEDTFELTALSNTLHHLPRYEAVIGEMLRVLKPGGYFVLNEMYRDQQDPARMVHTLQHSWEAKIDRLTGVYQRDTWKREELISFFRSLPLMETNIYEYEEDEISDRKIFEKNQTLSHKLEQVSGLPEFDGLKNEMKAIQALCLRDGIRRGVQLLCVGRLYG